MTQGPSQGYAPDAPPVIPSVMPVVPAAVRNPDMGLFAALGDSAKRSVT